MASLTLDPDARRARQRIAIVLALVLSLGAALALALTPTLHPRASLVAASVAFLIGLLALWARMMDIVALGIGVAASFAFLALLGTESGAITEPRVYIQSSAKLAFALLCLSLVLGPWARLWAWARPLLGSRRHVGVAVVLLAFAHALMVIATSFGFDISYVFEVSTVFLGSIKLQILALLGITSWNAIQGKPRSRAWSIVHTLGLILFVAEAIYVAQVAILPLTGWFIALFVGMGLLWLALAPWGLIKRIASIVNGWKQLHRLIYVAFPALVVHAWLLTISLEESVGDKIIFWLLVLVVVASHLAGWIRAWSKRRA